MPGSDMSLGPGEVVRIVNVGEHEFARTFEQKMYRIPAGGQLVMPKDAMWHWLGRPYLIDRDPLNMDRTEELQRLRVYYGAAGDTDQPVRMTSTELWEQNKPRLEAWDLEGNRITTVVDDPEGLSVNPTDTSQAEKNLVTATISQLSAQVTALQARLSQIEPGELSDVEELPVDDPKAVPVGARRGRELS